MDLGQELVENENNFFKQENLRYFRQYCDRGGKSDFFQNSLLQVRRNRLGSADLQADLFLSFCLHWW